MKEMTIAELLKKKKTLEEKLNSCINEFEIDTGIKISNIYSLRKYMHSDLTGEYVKASDVHITLDL